MANSPTSVLDAEQRAWRYWFADGLTNLTVGATSLLFAFCMLYTPRWPPSPLTMAAWAVALGLYMAMSLRQQKLVEWLKARTTYPRTGYVQPPATEGDSGSADLVTLSLHAPNTTSSEEAQRLLSGRKRRGILLLVLVLLAMFAMIAIQSRWTPSAAGVIVGVGMCISRKDYRWSWMVPLGFPIVGVCITLFSASLQKAPVYFCAGWGVLFFVDGATTLIRYLLQNPAPKVPAA